MIYLNLFKHSSWIWTYRRKFTYFARHSKEQHPTVVNNLKMKHIEISPQWRFSSVFRPHQWVGSESTCARDRVRKIHARGPTPLRIFRCEISHSRATLTNDFHIGPKSTRAEEIFGKRLVRYIDVYIGRGNFLSHWEKSCAAAKPTLVGRGDGARVLTSRRTRSGGFQSGGS